MKLTNTQQRDVRFIRALVHGDSGIGKTTSLAALPEDKTLIVALERGLLPLRKKNFHVLTIDAWQDLRELVRAFHHATIADDGGVSLTIDGQTIEGLRILAFDSLTECNQLCKRHIVEVDRPAIVIEKAKAKDADSEPTSHVIGTYDEQLTIPDWGLLASRMEGLVSAINHLPVHTIFTALSTWKEEKQTGSIFRIPALNGAFAISCPAHFDEVFHMESTQDNVRRWRTFNDNTHLCKDASGVLEPFEPADWNGIFSKILNGNSPATAPKRKGNKT